MGLRNVNMKPLTKASNFRKLSMGNWDGIGDPQVYAVIDLDCEQAVAYIEEMRNKHDIKFTINHLIGRIIALTLRKYPQLNGLIASGKIYLRKDVDIFYQVGMEDAETELVGICIKQGDQKGFPEFAEEMIQRSEAVRKSSTHPMRKAQMPFRYMPWRVARLACKIISWLQFDVNLNLKCFGLPKDALGSIMITAIGGLGIDMGLVPLAHIGRTPAQIAVGKVEPKPVVVDDQIVIRKRLNLCCTFDHRFMDGVLGSKMMRMLRELFENIDKHRELIEGKVSLDGYQLKY